MARFFVLLGRSKSVEDELDHVEREHGAVVNAKLLRGADGHVRGAVEIENTEEESCSS